MEHWFTTTELSLKYKRTASTIIKILEENNIDSQDRVINSHHVRIWDSDCIEVLEEKSRNDNTVVISDYAVELGVDEKLLRDAMKRVGHYGVLRTIRCKEVEDEVKNILKEENDNSENNHPLVTNKKFLQTSYFPDVIPSCFQELDEVSLW